MNNSNEKSKECCKDCECNCFTGNYSVLHHYKNCHNEECKCHKPSVEVSKWYKVTYITDSPELIDSTKCNLVDSTTIESIPLKN